MIDDWDNVDKMAEVFTIVCGQAVRPQMEFAKNYGLDSYDAIDDFVKMPADIQNLGKQIISKMGVAYLGVRGIEGLVVGSLLIYKTIALNAAKELLEMVKKGEKSCTQEQREKLEKFIEKEGESLKEKALDTAINTVAFIPIGLNALLTSFTKIPQGTVLMQSVSLANMLSYVLISGYSLYQAVKASDTFEDWKQKLVEKPMEESELRQLYATRNDEAAKQVLFLGPEFEKLLVQLQQKPDPAIAKSHGLSFSKAKRFYEYVQTLQGPDVPASSLATKYQAFQHLTLDKQIVEPEEGPLDGNELQALLTEESFKHALFEQFWDHKHTMEIGTRNALKALTSQKQATAVSSAHFNAVTAGITFAITSLAVAAMIAMKIAVVAGLIVIPAAVIGLPGGAGLGLLAIAMLAIGIYYLIRYKPHLFKSLISGTGIKLLANEIPLSFYNYRLQKALKQREEKIHIVKRLKEKENEIRTNIVKLEKNVESILKCKEAIKLLSSMRKKYNHQKEVLDDKIREIRQNMAGWKRRKNNYQRELNEARTNDLLLSSNLLTPKDPVMERIATNLIEGYADEATQQYMKKQMGIDLEMTKKTIQKAITAFFGMSEESLAEFCK